MIDVAGFLTPSEERRLASEVAALESDTGFKLRVLAQSYPETPGEPAALPHASPVPNPLRIPLASTSARSPLPPAGLAVRDYWGVDDNTIVFVADPTFANIINVNVGQGVDLEVPQVGVTWGVFCGGWGWG